MNLLLNLYLEMVYSAISAAGLPQDLRNHVLNIYLERVSSGNPARGVTRRVNESFTKPLPREG
jgi:hypothetical protein